LSNNGKEHDRQAGTGGGSTSPAKVTRRMSSFHLEHVKHFGAIDSLDGIKTKKW
jgi:hypothetical protein